MRAASESTLAVSIPPHGDGYVGNKAHGIHIHIDMGIRIHTQHLYTRTHTFKCLHNIHGQQHTVQQPCPAVVARTIFIPYPPTYLHTERDKHARVGSVMACRTMGGQFLRRDRPSAVLPSSKRLLPDWRSPNPPTPTKLQARLRLDRPPSHPPKRQKGGGEEATRSVNRSCSSQWAGRANGGRHHTVVCTPHAVPLRCTMRPRRFWAQSSPPQPTAPTPAFRARGVALCSSPCPVPAPSRNPRPPPCCHYCPAHSA